MKECLLNMLYLTSDAPDDLVRFVQSVMRPAVYEAFTSTPGAYLCGGAIRTSFSNSDEKPSDLDFYFADEITFNAFCEKIRRMPGIKEILSTERAITFRDNIVDETPVIQAVRFCFGTLPEVLDKFDFTIVQAGMTHDLKVCETLTYRSDIASNVLIYCNSDLPLSSLFRVIKYTRKGYRMQALEMVKLLKDLNSKVDLNDEESIRYHIESFDPGALDGDAPVILGMPDECPF